MTSKLLKRLVFGLVVIAVGIQFVRPARTNPPADPAQSVHATASVPPEVGAILKRSCYDCHSNETRWPWYSAVAPMAWALVDHVNEGRTEMNFSSWGAYSAAKRIAILEKMCEEVREGKMPLPQYLWLHRDARLAESDWKSVCDWSAEEADRLSSRR